MPVANERVSQRSRQRQKSWHGKWILNRRCERLIDYGIQTARPYIQTTRSYIQTARPYVQTVRPDTSNLTVNRGKWPGRRHPRQTRVCLGRGWGLASSPIGGSSYSCSARASSRPSGLNLAIVPVVERRGSLHTPTLRHRCVRTYGAMHALQRSVAISACGAPAPLRVNALPRTHTSVS